MNTNIKTAILQNERRKLENIETLFIGSKHHFQV